MPELPEVETIKNDLRPEIEGRRFSGVSIFWARMVLQPSVDELRQRLTGQMIKEVSRRGKYLIFRLSGGESLILHMRMTGSLLLVRKNEVPVDLNKYVRAIFSLDNGMELLFSDRRKLGTVALIKDESVLNSRLGPEPLTSPFTSVTFGKSLSNRKAPIKAVLCDQKVVAGIGNMYADEALFLANIHPLRIAGSLSKEEVERLHQAIIDVLIGAIGNAGATFSDYRRPNGEQGKQQYAFYVAHRGGQSCKACATPIERIPVRNRGTYFCPVCQDAATCSGN